MGKLILIIIAFLALYVIFRHFKSITSGEPTEDELSRLLLQKASSLSFYVSLYFWLVISYFADKFNFETSQLINYGIIGMALIFVLMWLGIKIYMFNKSIK